SPRADDLLQERLYCIRWAKPDGSQVFLAPTEADLVREAKVLELLAARLSGWQERGLVPSSAMTPDGEKTGEPIRTRGWTYWHHFFAPRQLLVNGLLAESMSRATHELQAAAMLAAGRLANWNSRLCSWDPSSGNEKGNQSFQNLALNPVC